MTEPKSLRRQRKQTLEKGRHLMGSVYLVLCVAVFYPVTSLLTRTKWLGLWRLPAEGPVLLVFNHVSHLDPLYDAVAVHRAGRVPRFLGKHTLWKVPVLGRVLVAVDQIPVFRGTADAKKSLSEAHAALESGKAILIYPDGTITRDPDGWPMVPKIGVARLALEHDVPVIPVARWGTRAVYDGYRKRFRPFPRKDVTVRIGDPIDLSAYRGKEVDARLLRETAEKIMGEVRELLAEIRDEEPPKQFFSLADRPARTDDE